jgi:hypothetical protein
VLVAKSQRFVRQSSFREHAITGCGAGESTRLSSSADFGVESGGFGVAVGLAQAPEKTKSTAQLNRSRRPIRASLPVTATQQN